MKKQLITSGLVIVLIALASTGFSQTTPRVHRRQINQQERIANGVKDGELTNRETLRLEGREAKIQHDKRVAKSDGVVTARERAKLTREQNRTSRAIYRQKHDVQTRK
ncbi:MAG: hypothetical protein QM802_17090 [Agriterribacter sp.]